MKFETFWWDIDNDISKINTEILLEMDSINIMEMYMTDEYSEKRKKLVKLNLTNRKSVEEPTTVHDVIASFHIRNITFVSFLQFIVY